MLSTKTQEQKDSAFTEYVTGSKKHTLNDIVMYCISSTTEVNPPVQDDAQPFILMMAAEEGNLSAVRMLVETYHADVNSQSQWPQSNAFSSAVGRPSEAVFLYLLNQVNAQTLSGGLLQSVISDRKEMFDLIIANPGLNVNYTSNELNRTALMLAIHYGKDAYVEKLITYPGLALEQTDSHGNTVLAYAVLHGQTALFNRLLNATPIGAKPASALFVGVAKKDIGLLRYLIITKGAKVNTKDISGNTALFRSNSSHANDEKIIHLFVAEGADLKVTNNQGHDLVRHNRTNPEFAALLVLYGATRPTDPAQFFGSFVTRYTNKLKEMKDRLKGELLELHEDVAKKVVEEYVFHKG